MKNKGFWFGFDETKTVEKVMKKAKEMGLVDVSKKFKFTPPDEMVPFVFHKR